MMLAASSLHRLPAAATHPRSLVRDLAGLLMQQMFFYGCDARHGGRNLLVRLGAHASTRAGKKAAATASRGRAGP